MIRSHFIQLAIAFVILALSMGVVAAGVLIVSAEQKKAEELAQQVHAKKEETVRVTAAKAALPLLAQAEERVQEHLLSPDDIVPFLQQLEAQGKAQGARVEVLSVNPISSASGSRIALSVNITGTYDAVMRTLGTIEYGPYDAAATNVSIGIADTKGKGPAQWVAAAVFSLGTKTVTTIP